MARTLIRTAMLIMTAILFSAPGAVAGQETPRAALDIANHPFKGPENAPVVMVAFSDYL